MLPGERVGLHHDLWRPVNQKGPATEPPLHTSALRKAIVRLQPPAIASSWAE
jgi:hypothetical protein